VEWNAAIRPWWTIWMAAFLPLLIAMEAAGIVNAEHAGRNWKQLFTLPIARWKFVAAKAVVCASLIAVSFAVFSVGVLGLGLLRGSLFRVDMGRAIPWELLVRLTLRGFVASTAAIAAQLCVSIRLPGFVAALGAGLGATVLGAAMGPLNLAGWWPWSMPLDTLPWGGLYHVPAHITIAPVICVVLVWLAGWWMSRAEIV